ncbi:hypothetical protein T11_16922 [Trichinella zimbabwensis]|uniref:Uncharacterized protein n=1 Tax=Trichinella zimbabwensis TaxID=268475 RepID=A0A0V1H2N1_9BILA|nr:hypothetical protein T11_16922 [Trichinella zimbabwensis]
MNENSSIDVICICKALQTTIITSSVYPKAKGFLCACMDCLKIGWSGLEMEKIMTNLDGDNAMLKL